MHGSPLTNLINLLEQRELLRSLLEQTERGITAMLELRVRELEQAQAVTDLEIALRREPPMNRKEFARAIGVSVTTVDAMIADGRLEPIRIGNRTLFTLAHKQDVLSAGYTPRGGAK